MAISYNVVPNALTSPPSFSCRVAPNLILDYDEIATQINLHNPTIPIVTAKSVLEAFRAECKIQLLAGNTIKLSGFISLVNTMPIRLAAATDPIVGKPVQPVVKIAVPFRDEVKTDSSYTRVGYPTKDPSVIEAKDTNTGLIAFIETGRGFRIDGKAIGFDPDDADLGVYLVDSTAAETKQTNITINDPSLIAVTPDFTVVGPSYSELTLLLRNRYTANGTVRSGTYARKLRSVVTLGGANPNLVFCVGDATSEAEIAYGGADVRGVMVAFLDNENVLGVKLRTITGEFGAVTQITEAADYEIAGLASPVTLTVGNYQKLYDNVVLYQRYMQEIVDFTDVIP